MIPKSPVQAALVGLGRWAEVIAERVGGIPELEITGCFTRSEERHAAFANKYSCRAYPSFEAILEDGEIEAVLLTTPHSIHHPQILAAAQAGKHVFVEKPLALTVQDARSAIEACRRADRTLMVGHCWRWLGPVQKVKAMLEAGELGMVTQATGHFGNPRAQNFGQEIWRDEPTESPGGPLTGPGFHLLDILHQLLGPVRDVNATFDRRLPERSAVDTAMVTLKFESGTLAHVSTSFITHRCFQLSLFGTNANAHLNLDPRGGPGNLSSLTVQRNGEPEPVPVPDEDMIQRQMATFARSVRTGTTPPTDGKVGFALVALLEALLASSNSHGWESPVSLTSPVL